MTREPIDMAIEAKSDQLNSIDLLGGPRTITITGIKRVEDPKQPIWISFEGDNGKPWKPCLTMRRVMVGVWGKDGATYIGNRMTLYLDPSVPWGGKEAGGTRVSHMSGISEEKTVIVQVARGRKAPLTVKPLADERPGPTVDEAQDAARQAAQGGGESFRMWWNTDYGRLCRELVKPIMGELKVTVSEADQKVGGECGSENTWKG